MSSGNKLQPLLGSPAPPPAFALSPASQQAPRCDCRGGVQHPGSACSLPRGGFWQAARYPEHGSVRPPCPCNGRSGLGAVVAAGLRGEPLPAPPQRAGPREGRAEQTRLRATGLVQLRPRSANPQDLLGSPLPCVSPSSAPQRGALLPPEVAARPGAGSRGPVGWAGCLARSFLGTRALLSEALGFSRCTAVIILVLALSPAGLGPRRSGLVFRAGGWEALTRPVAGMVSEGDSTRVRKKKKQSRVPVC